MAVKLKKLLRRNPQEAGVSKWYLSNESTGRILQRALEASNLWFAMTEHLMYEKHSRAGDNGD